MAMLAAESQQVMWLRLMKLSAGGAAAQAEANRMTSEKVVAGAQAMGRLMLGDSPDRMVSHYRRKVRANARRLSR